jgi:hypothetical protein
MNRTIPKVLFLLFNAAVCYSQTYDIVLANGRVMDPETNLDAVRNVGIRGGKIAAISTSPLEGRTVADVKGLYEYTPSHQTSRIAIDTEFSARTRFSSERFHRSSTQPLPEISSLRAPRKRARSNPAAVAFVELVCRAPDSL